MTIWEKAILNMHKGTQKLSVAAATFSERVKAEITIARLRIRLDDVQSLIDEQYRIIGRKVAGLKNRSELPKTAEQLMKDAEIAVALAEIEAREKDIEDLKAGIAQEQAAFRPEPEQKEDSVP